MIIIRRIQQVLRTIREEPEHGQIILQWQGYADLQGKDNLFEEN